jgi:hypothetical protein|mmetsp:Transcript_23268/g.31066  ORF Transcript_23268/g.31066 Transcript_23268/m.31066 type:complete len:81 (+) Transcript_23268:195-437(+)
MREAMTISGVEPGDLEIKDLTEFAKPGIDKDVANLRFKHYQDRLIDLINEMLYERKRIKEAHQKLDNRNQTMRSASPGFA